VNDTASNAARDGEISRELKISNKFGIHARPAAMFVKAASRYDSEVTVEKDGNAVSGKSIMGLMTLEASCGVRIKVTAKGPDAEKVVEALRELIDSKFYED
jgi:phosphocarrier protein|tara:strand:- start:413 stop:715 length:303 start_codon:yes stop_codon:yes gene_type:complete